MPRRQSTPMKYWGFYASEELKAETQRIAIQLNESDAEYIRKAVEQRNAQQHRRENMNPSDILESVQDSGNRTEYFPVMPHRETEAKALFNDEHPYQEKTVKPEISKLKQ